MNTQENIIHDIFVIVHNLKKNFKLFIQEYGLTLMEAKFIFYIGEGHQKTSDLICHFEKHKSTIRQKTKSLENKGYIVIENAPDDKRERVLSFTKKGKVFYERSRSLKKEYYANIFQKFNSQQEDKLFELLNMLTINERNDHEIC